MYSSYAWVLFCNVGSSHNTGYLLYSSYAWVLFCNVGSSHNAGYLLYSSYAWVLLSLLYCSGLGVGKEGGGGKGRGHFKGKMNQNSPIVELSIIDTDLDKRTSTTVESKRRAPFKRQTDTWTFGHIHFVF